MIINIWTCMHIVVLNMGLIMFCCVYNLSIRTPSDVLAGNWEHFFSLRCYNFVFIICPNLLFSLFLTCRHKLLAGMAYYFWCILFPHETWMHWFCRFCWQTSVSTSRWWSAYPQDKSCYMVACTNYPCWACNECFKYRLAKGSLACYCFCAMTYFQSCFVL